MNLSSRITFDSQYCPGVTVTLRRLTASKRCELDRAQAKFRQAQRDLMMRWIPFVPDPGEIVGDPCEHCGRADVKRSGDSVEELIRKNVESQALQAEWDVLEREAGIGAIPFIVQQIEGELIVDGESVTIDNLVELAPVELLDEIVTHFPALRLSPLDSKNSPSSTTSEPPVDGRTKGTTAMSAGDQNFIAAETAGSTSPGA